MKLKSSMLVFLVLCATVNLPVLFLLSLSYSARAVAPAIVSDFPHYDDERNAHEMDRIFAKRIADRFQPGIAEDELVAWLHFNAFAPSGFTPREGGEYMAMRAVPRPGWFDFCRSTAYIRWKSDAKRVVTQIHGSAFTECVYP